MLKKRGILIGASQLFCLFAIAATAFSAMELPDRLKEMPTYPNSKIIQVMDMNDSSVAVLQVKATLDDAIDFFRKTIKDKGWKIVFQSEQEDNAVLHFTKDGQAFNLSIHAGDEEGTVQYELVAAPGS